MLALSTPAMVCNAALKRVGALYRIGNLFDGSAVADAALAIYAQTRDEKLLASDWAFARRTAMLAQLKNAPPGGYYPGQPWNPALYPPIGWNFEYSYPSDCLKLRSLRSPYSEGAIIPDFAPRPVEFSEENDNNYNPARKVILTNLPNAIAIYTAQVTDPLTWTAGYTETLIDALGERLAPAVGKLSQEGAAGAKLLSAEEVAAETAAEARVG